MECASLKGKALQQIQKGMTATFAVVQVHFWGAPRQTSRAQQLFAIGAVGYVKPCNIENMMVHFWAHLPKVTHSGTLSNATV